MHTTDQRVLFTRNRGGVGERNKKNFGCVNECRFMIDGLFLSFLGDFFHARVSKIFIGGEK